jgi:hypothetical protein
MLSTQVAFAPCNPWDLHGLTPHYQRRWSSHLVTPWGLYGLTPCSQRRRAFTSLVKRGLHGLLPCYQRRWVSHLITPGVSTASCRTIPAGGPRISSSSGRPTASRRVINTGRPRPRYPRDLHGLTSYYQRKWTSPLVALGASTASCRVINVQRRCPLLLVTLGVSAVSHHTLRNPRDLPGLTPCYQRRWASHLYLCVSSRPHAVPFLHISCYAGLPGLTPSYQRRWTSPLIALVSPRPHPYYQRMWTPHLIPLGVSTVSRRVIDTGSLRTS